MQKGILFLVLGQDTNVGWVDGGGGKEWAEIEFLWQLNVWWRFRVTEFLTEK